MIGGVVGSGVCVVGSPGLAIVARQEKITYITLTVEPVASSSSPFRHLQYKKLDL